MIAGCLSLFEDGWPGDEERGHDCTYPARVLRAGEDDQGDRSRAARIAQHGAQGGALGRDGVHLQALCAAPAEARGLEGCDKAIELILRRASIALLSFPDESKLRQCNPGQGDRLGRGNHTVHGSRV